MQGFNDAPILLRRVSGRVWGNGTAVARGVLTSVMRMTRLRSPGFRQTLAEQTPDHHTLGSTSLIESEAVNSACDASFNRNSIRAPWARAFEQRDAVLFQSPDRKKLSAARKNQPRVTESGKKDWILGRSQQPCSTGFAGISSNFPIFKKLNFFHRIFLKLNRY